MAELLDRALEAAEALRERLLSAASSSDVDLAVLQAEIMALRGTLLESVRAERIRDGGRHNPASGVPADILALARSAGLVVAWRAHAARVGISEEEAREPVLAAVAAAAAHRPASADAVPTAEELRTGLEAIAYDNKLDEVARRAIALRLLDPVMLAEVRQAAEVTPETVVRGRVHM